MKCRWYADFEGVCTNGECPYRGDTCPTSEHPEVCKYSENKYEVSELVKILRCGAGDEHKCADCAANLKNKCDSKEANRQAADMLEKLAAERDAQKPERISVEDRPPEKKHEAYLCSLDSCLLSGGQYIDDIRVFYGDGKWGGTARSLTGCRGPSHRRRKTMIKLSGLSDDTLLVVDEDEGKHHEKVQ